MKSSILITLFHISSHNSSIYEFVASNTASKFLSQYPHRLDKKLKIKHQIQSDMSQKLKSLDKIAYLKYK